MSSISDIAFKYFLPTKHFITKDYANETYEFEMLREQMIKIFLENNDTDTLSNIYYIVKGSSIPLITFAEIIMRINKKDDVENFLHYYFKYDTTNLCETTVIYNTINAFKYLKKYLIQNSASITSQNNIDVKLIVYMSDVFTENHKNVCFDLEKINLFIRQNKWEDTDVKLYNLFEKYNLMKYDKLSFALKKSFSDEIFRIPPAFKAPYNNTTVNFLMNLCEIADLKSTKLYVVYEIYKYTNYFLENNITMPLNSENFQTASVEKADEIMKKIQNDIDTILPKYFNDIIIEELTKYKRLAVNAKM
jgi:hypothetical protein